jgi:prevent-host-death family protein
MQFSASETPSDIYGHFEMTMWYNLSMKKVAAAEFKAHCLALMEDVRSTREPLVITKRGKPVVKLVPADDDKDDFIGRLEGRFRVVGDIESPIDGWESS